ncbi:hypothetical protein C8Q70DRAFT_561939 [Cubamyces menziesii]|nr:hypothetical protein C8Q70DRAFT_561939 [Cubamyces menziesii]
MLSLSSLLLWSLGALFLRVLWRSVLRVYLSSLRAIRGPPIPSVLYGHVRQVCRAGNATTMREWEAQYGQNAFCCYLLQVAPLPSAPSGLTFNHRTLSRSRVSGRPTLWLFGTFCIPETTVSHGRRRCPQQRSLATVSALSNSKSTVPSHGHAGVLVAEG